MAKYINADGFIKNMSDIRESVMQKHKLEHGDAAIDGYDADLLRAIGFARKLVSEYPTADVRPNVKGEWAYDESISYSSCPCSVCGSEALYKVDWYESGQGQSCNIEKYKSNFCPTCGADMRGEK